MAAEDYSAEVFDTAIIVFNYSSVEMSRSHWGDRSEQIHQ
jgi:hypothetical protein